MLKPIMLKAKGASALADTPLYNSIYKYLMYLLPPYHGLKIFCP